MDAPLKKRGPTSTASVEADPYLSISDVTRCINDILASQLPQLLFRGEISQITVAQSGHLYFTLKDEGAQMSCVMWAGTARTLRFKPQAGMVVRCHGSASVYPQQGRLQVTVTRMVEDGEGDLQRRFLELKLRLEREGFFSPERKRPIPFLPRAVGIVTSKTGAVIHDMLVKIRERFPSMIVYLSESRVQGEGAALEIAAALKRLDDSGLVDVIIVTRGGGSLEDLWAFNEEALVKAVFSCSTPIISGVGHEVDTTLCDLVADLRAPTPTAAAEICVPKVSDLLVRVAELERRLRDVDRWLKPRVQRVDELSARLNMRIAACIGEARVHLKAAEAILAGIRPDRVLHLFRTQIDSLHARLRQTGRASNKLLLGGIEALQMRLRTGSLRRVEGVHDIVRTLELRLKALSPQKVLERGFSIVSVGGRHVRSVSEVKVGELMDVSIVDGVLSGTVSNVSDVSKEEGRWPKE